MKKIILSSFMMLFSLGALCATFPSNDNTNKEYESDSIKNIVNQIKLPIVQILTENGEEPSCKNISHPEGCIGQSITDNNYVKGTMIIRNDKDTIYDSGEYVKKKSGMRIKVRGNTSADFPFKSFKIKTEVKTDLLKRNVEKYESKSWVLLNIYSTRDLRTVTGFYLPKLVRENSWEPEYHFVNLFINNEYRGLYMLAESIGYSEGRYQLKDDSGLLIEADAYWWKEGPDDPVIKTDHLPYAIGYTFKNPELDPDSPVLDEIKDYLNAFEDSLYNNKDISKYIDIKSFASWVMVHDLLGTWDGAGSNIYISKDDFLDGDELYDTKLCMGPLWDFDSAFGTPSHWGASHESEFFYFPELFKRPEFIKEYQNLWMDIRYDVTSQLISFLEEFISKYGEAIDQSRKVSPPDTSLWPSTTSDDLNEIKNWFSERIPWMDKEVEELLQTVSVSQIENKNSIVSAAIYDINGRLCKILRDSEAASLLHGCTNITHTSYILPGVYIVKYTYSDGTTLSRKLVL